MKILDIQSVETCETRTDGKYPLRIGSTVEFYRKPIAGVPMILKYVTDNQGNLKEGYLTTSSVIDVDETKEYVVVTTKNSIYYFQK